MRARSVSASVEHQYREPQSLTGRDAGALILLPDAPQQVDGGRVQRVGTLPARIGGVDRTIVGVY